MPTKQKSRVDREERIREKLLDACRAALQALELSDQNRFDGGKLTRQLKAAIKAADPKERT